MYSLSRIFSGIVLYFTCISVTKKNKHIYTHAHKALFTLFTFNMPSNQMHVYICYKFTLKSSHWQSNRTKITKEKEKKNNHHLNKIGSCESYFDLNLSHINACRWFSLLLFCSVHHVNCIKQRKNSNSRFFSLDDVIENDEVRVSPKNDFDV